MSFQLKTQRIMQVTALFATLYATSTFALAAKKADSATAPLVSDKSLPKIITIGIVDGESTEEMSVVTVRFSDKPDLGKLEIQEHGTFLQILLPGTVVPNPGQFFEGNSPIIKKIAILQTSPTETALRLFVTEDAALIKSATEAVIMDTRLVITTDHHELRKLLSNKPMNVEKLLDTAAVPPALVPTVDTTPKTVGTKAGIAKLAANNYKDKLIEMAIYSGVLLLILLFVISLKPLLRKRQMMIQGDSYVPMKLLSNLALAPRQKLSLVQVGNEQILLSISPDKIEFISKIGENQRPMNQQQQPLSMQSPSAPAQRQITQPPPRPSSLGNGPLVRDAMDEDDYPKQRTPRPDLQPSGRRPESNREKPQSRPKSATNQPRGIQVEISDQGIKDVSTKSRLRNEGASGSIDDVTRMIREKLKNLPSI